MKKLLLPLLALMLAACLDCGGGEGPTEPEPSESPQPTWRCYDDRDCPGGWCPTYRGAQARCEAREGT